MKEDFDYQAMLAGQLYQAVGILPENGSVEGKKRAHEINHLPVDNREGIIAKEKVLFGKFGQCSDPQKLDFYGVEKSTPFLYDKINC